MTNKRRIIAGLACLSLAVALCAGGSSRVAEAQDVNYATILEVGGGIAGLREDRTVGGACHPGKVRDRCVVTHVDGGGHCELLGWASASEADCRCSVHLGLPAFQGMKCRVVVEEKSVAPVPSRSSPRGVCAAANPAFPTGGAAPAFPAAVDLSTATLALFVVGPNHAAHADANGSDHPRAAAIRGIAGRIRQAAPNGRRVVVAISETGGCDDCGSPATIFPGGAAHTLADELQRQYGTPFETRRAIPRLATDYTSMPALVYGADWRQETQANFIGADFPGPLTTPSKRYAFTRLTSGGVTVAFYVVHLATNESQDRRAQMEFLLGEAQRQVATTAFVLGDFNTNTRAYANGGFTDRNDHAWLQKCGDKSDWISADAPCVFSRADNARATTNLFGNLVSLIQFSNPSRPSPQTLRPIAYAFDPSGTGDPVETSEPLHFADIAHGGIGVFYKAETRPSCSGLGTDANCGACGDSCNGAQSCVQGACGCGTRTACGAGCFDLSTDPSHCGSCANACAAGTACSAGRCQCTNPAQRLCGDRCRDVTTDESNCGACGTRCATGTQCRNGVCGACPSGQRLCLRGGPRCIPASMYAHACREP